MGRMNVAQFLSGGLKVAQAQMEGHQQGLQERAARIQEQLQQAHQLMEQGHAGEEAEDQQLQALIPRLAPTDQGRAQSYLLGRAHARAQRRQLFAQNAAQQLGIQLPQQQAAQPFPAPQALPPPTAPRVEQGASPAAPAAVTGASGASPSPSPVETGQGAQPGAMTPEQVAMLLAAAPVIPGGADVGMMLAQREQAQQAPPAAQAGASPGAGAGATLLPDEVTPPAQTLEIPGLGTVALGPDPGQVDKATRQIAARMALLQGYRPKDQAERDAITGALSGLPDEIATEGDLKKVRRFMRDTNRYVPGSSPAVERLQSAEDLKAREFAAKAHAAEARAMDEVNSRFDKVVTRISSPQFARLDKKSQQPALDEFKRLAGVLGYDPGDIDQVIAGISPEAAVQQKQAEDRLKFAREKAAAAQKAADARMKLDQQKEADRRQQFDRRMALSQQGFELKRQQASVKAVNAQIGGKMSPTDRSSWAANLRMFLGTKKDITGQTVFSFDPDQRARAWENMAAIAQRNGGDVSTLPPPPPGARIPSYHPQAQQQATPQRQPGGPPMLPHVGVDASQRKGQPAPAGKPVPQAAGATGPGIGVSIEPHLVDRWIERGEFDQQMATNPHLRDPGLRAQAKALYQQATGRPWTGGATQRRPAPAAPARKPAAARKSGASLKNASEADLWRALSGGK